MSRSTHPGRARGTRVTLLALLAIAVAGPGSAQVGRGERKIGTVISLPRRDFGRFVAANVRRGNNVNFLHLSQLAAGDLNTQVATVGVTQRNTGEPARSVYIPTRGTGKVPQIYEQLNVNDTFVEQQAIGRGNTQVVQVDVSQAAEQAQETYVPGRTRFLMVPVDGLPALKQANVQKNINQVDVIQTAIGDQNTQVALVAVDQANATDLKVPGQSLVNAITNINVNVVVQTAVGTGNTQVATIGVNQQNAPAAQ